MSNRGFTLIEVLAVLAILGIILAIAVPSVGKIIQDSRKEVCHANSKMLVKAYKKDLTIESLEHSDALFSQFIVEADGKMHPEQGNLSYIDGKVHCSVHPIEDEIEQEEVSSDGVPFL